MTDTLTQRARDVAGRLLTSTKGEDAADDCAIDEAAAIISELVERIEGLELGAILKEVQ